MSMYCGWQEAMMPFHGYDHASTGWKSKYLPFGLDLNALTAAGSRTGTDLSSAYQTGWPGVVGSAGTLFQDASSLYNAATDTPVVSQAPPLLQAPTATPSGGGISPILLLAAAGAAYFFLLR